MCWQAHMHAQKGSKLKRTPNFVVWGWVGQVVVRQHPTPTTNTHEFATRVETPSLHTCLYVCMNEWRYLCMYVCMYVCNMYVSMYVCMYVCMFVCMFYIYINIYMHAGELLVCPLFCLFESYSFVHRFVKISFLQQGEAFWELLVCPPKSYLFVHFGGHFWPQKVDKLITLKVDKLITLWRLYVFPYLGLFGPFLEKPEP